MSVVNLDDLEWMIGIVKGAMEYGTLNYSNEDWKRMEFLYKVIYNE